MTSLIVVLSLSALPLFGRVADVNAKKQTWPISGTAYAIMLDGTVLAQYNFSDEVVVAAYPTGAKELRKPEGRLSSNDASNQTVFQQVSAYDALGMLVGSEANISRQRFLETLDRRSSQLLFIIAVDYSGVVHRVVKW